LSVLYLHRFLTAFRKAALDRRFGAVLGGDADDFVVLCQRKAPPVRAILRRWVTAMGLELNERKPSVQQARHEAVDCLGYTFTLRPSDQTGVLSPGAPPSQKASQRLKHALRGWLTRTNSQPPAEVVDPRTRKLRGGAPSFHSGSVQRVRQNLEALVYQRVRGFLRRRPQGQTRAHRRFSRRYVCQALGVVSLPALGKSV